MNKMNKRNQSEEFVAKSDSIRLRITQVFVQN